VSNSSGAAVNIDETLAPPKYSMTTKACPITSSISWMVQTFACFSAEAALASR
jgi:hypothetical protein